MARDNSRIKAVRGADEQPQQEEMTVVVLRFRGTGHSLQKGFDAVSQAIAALGPAPPQTQQRIYTRPPAQVPAAAAADLVVDAEHEETGRDGDQPQAISEAQPVPRSRRAVGERKGYTFDNQFDLTPAGMPSWKDYCAQKNPQSETDKLLVAAAWMQTHGGLTTFTGRHLFTCFRAMEWKTQVDMIQPLRVMKNRKSYYENPEQGQWRLTGIGLAAAEKVGTE